MRSFGFREAAEYWGVAANPELAFRLHALVGGTPEYRGLSGGAGPRSLAEFDHWVRQWLLDAASPMFSAGRLLPAEGTSIADPVACVSALDAISGGVARPVEIAAALGRPAG